VPRDRSLASADFRFDVGDAAFELEAGSALAFFFGAFAFFFGAFAFFFDALALRGCLLGNCQLLPGEPTPKSFAVVRDFERGGRGNEPRAERLGGSRRVTRVHAFEHSDAVATPYLQQ